MPNSLAMSLVLAFCRSIVTPSYLTDPVTATRTFFEAAADNVRDTDYADACPIGTVASFYIPFDETIRLRFAWGDHLFAAAVVFLIGFRVALNVVCPNFQPRPQLRRRDSRLF